MKGFVEVHVGEAPTLVRVDRICWVGTDKRDESAIIWVQGGIAPLTVSESYAEVVQKMQEAM